MEVIRHTTHFLGIYMEYKNKLIVYKKFLLANILLSIALSIRYFLFLPDFPDGLLEIAFLASSLVGQMALLGGIVGLLGLICILLPRYLFVVSVSLLATFVLSILLVDTFVFSQYRFHINEVVLKLVMSGDVVDFSLMTWLLTCFFVVCLFGLEVLLSLYLFKWPRKESTRKPFLWSFVLLFFVSNFIHVWAAANAYQPVLILKNYLPLFQPATANRLMQKYGWIDEEALAKQRALSLKGSSDIHYPLSEITYKEHGKKPNIVFLVIDSWRYDTFNSNNTPNLWRFAQHGVTYDRHFATGNSTRTGIFGLFYGMPGTYWHDMLSNQRPPILMDRLQALDYQMGIFASASLLDPEFNRTVFANLTNLRVRSDGSSPSARDEDLTKDWLHWYVDRDVSRPSFSFLFYDAPHGYDFPEAYPSHYEPMLDDVNYLSLSNDMDPKPFLNRYKNSVHFVDSLAKNVLDALEESGELDNTIVIITGDHGQEFNDNRLNYWGHNGNFTPAQTHVPFAIVGPKFDSENAMSLGMTSHEDVVPTLMKHFLGASVDSSIYSTGLDLLADDVHRNWLISSSYGAYAMITEDSILEVSHSGQYQFMDLSNRVKESEEPNMQYMKAMLERLSRFKSK
ncbi:DUF3413 domain-containing protein [Marinomonas posidonica]|uniref:DUF3413 domain-containing protein n=1 Tax=Marinomonas posidonica TaxID=936476 RepID=UPI003736503B